MLKSFFIGVLVTAFIIGLFWFYTGRNDIRSIRKNYNELAENIKQVQRNIHELRTDSDGFANDINTVTKGIESSRVRVGSSNERLSESDGIIREQLIKVEQLERWNRESIVLGRNFGEELYNLRKLNKESGEKN